MYTRYIFEMIFGFTFLLSGCYGTVNGMKKDIVEFPQNVAKTWQQAKEMDAWMQKNLW